MLPTLDQFSVTDRWRMIISGIPGIHVPVFKGVHRFEIV